LARSFFTEPSLVIPSRVARAAPPSPSKTLDRPGAPLGLVQLARSPLSLAAKPRPVRNSPLGGDSLIIMFWHQMVAVMLGFWEIPPRREAPAASFPATQK